MRIWKEAVVAHLKALSRNLLWEVKSLCFNWAPHHEGVLGNGIAPRILHLVTRRRWVVSFMPRPLYPQGKSPWYPLDERLGGPQSRSGRSGEEKNSPPLSGIEWNPRKAPDWSVTRPRLDWVLRSASLEPTATPRCSVCSELGWTWYEVAWLIWRNWGRWCGASSAKEDRHLCPSGAFQQFCLER